MRTEWGFRIKHGYKIVADDCESSRNELGHVVLGGGSDLRLTGCKSQQNRTGCLVSGGNLTAHELRMSKAMHAI